MIRVIASIRIRAGKMTEFLHICKANVPAVRAEKGCLEYIPAVDIDSKLPTQGLDPQLVTIIEKWESLEALHRHLKAPHMLAYRDKVNDLVERRTLKVLTEA